MVYIENKTWQTCMKIYPLCTDILNANILSETNIYNPISETPSPTLGKNVQNTSSWCGGAEGGGYPYNIDKIERKVEKGHNAIISEGEGS